MGCSVFVCKYCQCPNIQSHTSQHVMPIAHTIVNATAPTIVNTTPISPTRPGTPTVPTITPRLDNNIITLEPSINTSGIELPIAIIIYQTINSEVC